MVINKQNRYYQPQLVNLDITKKWVTLGFLESFQMMARGFIKSTDFGIKFTIFARQNMVTRVP
jgi:hypothetical protein